MDKLDLYAKQNEREAEDLIRVAAREYMQGNLTEGELKLSMRRAFQLGHNAGRCRGENYINRRGFA
jgi:hypothetical protein